MLPLAPHAQALELGALDRHPLRGVGAAAPAQRHAVGALAAGAELLRDLDLDRHAVVVPARDEGRVEAPDRGRAHHGVLPDLVRGRAHVEVAVRVGRAVVEQPHRPAGPRLAEPRVHPVLRPPREPLGLAAGQVRLHRELGPGKVERVAIARHSQLLDSRPAAKTKTPQRTRWGDEVAVPPNFAAADSGVRRAPRSASGSASRRSRPLSGGIPSRPTGARRGARGAVPAGRFGWRLGGDLHRARGCRAPTVPGSLGRAARLLVPFKALRGPPCQRGPRGSSVWSSSGRCARGAAYSSRQVRFVNLPPYLVMYCWIASAL